MRDQEATGQTAEEAEAEEATPQLVLDPVDADRGKGVQDVVGGVVDSGRRGGCNWGLMGTLCNLLMGTELERPLEGLRVIIVVRVGEGR
jgi:hypothetical protein